MLAVNKSVLIVGAGPVGMTLACLLMKLNIKPIVIDKREAPSSITRGVGISFSSLSVFNKIDILQDVLQKSIINKTISVFYNKQALLEIDHSLYKQSIPGFVHLEQIEVEKILIKKLSEMGCDIHRNCELVNLTNNNGKYTAEVQSEHSKKQIEADYIVGCDGASSTVKKLLKYEEEYEDYQQYFTVVDCFIDNFILENDQYYIENDGYLMMVTLPEGKIRIIYSGKSLIAETKVNIDLVKLQLFNFTGKILDIHTIDWETSGKFYHRIVKNAVNANVLLAGDAMHAFSPIGGLNMNMGILDAENLACKLKDLLIEGNSNALFEYNRERMEACHQLKESTRLATKFMVDWKNQASLINVLGFEASIENILKKVPEILSGCSLTYTNNGKQFFRKPYLDQEYNWTGSYRLLLFIETLTDEYMNKILEIEQEISRKIQVNTIIFVKATLVNVHKYNLKIRVDKFAFEIFGITYNQFLILRNDDYVIQAIDLR